MTLNEQFATMLVMTAMGVWIGIALATYQRFFHPKRRWHWLMIITDILFWFVQGLLVFLVLLYTNEGTVRFYIFLAIACGYAGYKGLLESLYKNMLENVIQVVTRLILLTKRILYRLLIYPAFVLLKVLYASCKIIVGSLLTVFLFIISVVVYPLKWLYKLLVPKSFIEFVEGLIQRVMKLYEHIFRKKR